ncbi:MAG: DNA polymerase III subunit delta [Melioribacteraceae bacterium]|nr:DNA polymerase III subunit delta [Melioribacteraceae bacterium]MCF8263959.1 DNA polymerase III subunit delta [Melioribacteraceae bacterium]MCF8411811.1 DNA polymerase III subunit delta [Melioribacteraceae bacterium]MCF8431329.1 DNA polymerase III subunit delta [Melioribacteraceae bacterium]
MAKPRPKVPSIYEVANFLKEGSILPIYFFAGTDLHTIDNAVKAVEKVVSPLVDSEFDRETISLDKSNSIQQIMDLALSFPFGNGKKLLILKNFNSINDKKLFAEYVKSPAEFTIMIVTHPGKLGSVTGEPFKSLLSNKFLFEAKELQGEELVRWLIKQAAKAGMNIARNDAEYLVDMVGEDKSLLEMQIEKFSTYLSGEKTIDKDIIDKLASETKEYTIFNLQEALGKGDRHKSLVIIYNLLDNGKDLVFINAMLIKFIITLAKILELSGEKINDFEAAGKANLNPFYYMNCRKAQYLLKEKRIHQAAKALYNSELALKTSAQDPKTLATIMISDILN